MKILILANHFNTLRIFRRELIKEISARGHEIVISIPTCDEENKNILESYGTRVIFTPFERRGTNPLKDLSLLKEYKKLIKAERPDKVIAYTIKCNIYGGFACKSAKIPFYANVTGLGSTFQSKGFMRSLVTMLYKHSLKKAKRVFFENVGNRDVFIDNKIVKSSQTFALPGAGVNLQDFGHTAYPSDEALIRFLFIGRIMREKGVDEYFEAIKRIKAEYPNAAFDFIGWYEDDYESIVKNMENEGLLRFHGFLADVKPYIENSHCVVLPSWHEGMSNTLLESAAMCRPLITTKIHGCMEAVEDGTNGFLVNVRDSNSLYEAIARFINLSHSEKEAMGTAGRVRMQELFDKNMVVSLTLKEIFD